MSSDEKSDNSTGGRPFQLRPSSLSGSGFGSPFSTSMGERGNKGFILRPSSLTSAADKIEKTDSRKRSINNDEDLEKDIENETKKTKTSEEPKGSESLKLTEDIEKPSGIGTFGFDDDKSNAKQKNGENHCENGGTSKNYFAQNINPNEKIGFVFGNNSSTNVGFGTLKENENDSNNDTADECNKNNTTPESTPKETEVSCHEKLLENATEYEKTHCNREQYKEVEQFTGEEGEQHVLHIFCKLHVFDKEKKNWLERGRGNLKLNDICQSEGCFQSRLVFRTQGTNLVQLNTKLWPDMCCEKVKEKSIRISALDPETKDVKVYLITGSIKDVLQAYTAIDRRISALKRSHNAAQKDRSKENSNDSTKDVSSANEDSNSDGEQENKRQTTIGNPEAEGKDSSVEEESE